MYYKHTMQMTVRYLTPKSYWWCVVFLQATMEALLALGLHKQAEQLYRDFRVPDKRWDIQEVMSLLSLLWLAEHMISR